ncbi:hypothetical protein BE21_58530 [Sorangium cellulosum]|uniref:Uncharacterized protein n=1 Tax=Sorangium cellulosum TaxID=56 RepID=A0A150U1T6_SORCE|nr:hypothetical protein BE18_43775 [Sorangium cellulosum]KYF95683.1 hypothetical protein BE20_44655 [Sorangium cellulosum]KYG10901.1 hypothetical protein BE21_58530 [Sorangium cellulosum]
MPRGRSMASQSNRRVEAVHLASWGSEEVSVGLPPTTTYADWLDAGSRVFRVDVPNVEPLDVLFLDCSFTLEFLASSTADRSLASRRRRASDIRCRSSGWIRGPGDRNDYEPSEQM